MTYNGWKNWETWNVALWLGNDEGLYRSCIETAKNQGGKPITADEADEIVSVLMPNGTPDFKSEHHGHKQGARLYANVDWQAIADDINEMAGLD